MSGKYRSGTECPGCKAKIGVGHLMCWKCFKGDRADGKTCYKYWQTPRHLWGNEDASVDAWLEYIKGAQPQLQ